MRPLNLSPAALQKTGNTENQKRWLKRQVNDIKIAHCSLIQDMLTSLPDAKKEPVSAILNIST